MGTTAREGSSMPSPTRLLFLPPVRQLVGNRRVRLAVIPPHGSILQKPPLPSSLYHIALSADTCRLEWPGCQYNFVIGTCFVLHKLKLNKKNILGEHEKKKFFGEKKKKKKKKKKKS